MFKDKETLPLPPIGFNKKTSNACQKALEHAIRTKKLVRLHFGDRQSGIDSLEENNVVGVLAKAFGKETLILCPEGFLGGTEVRDENLLRIVEVSTGRVLYQHPSYSRPELFIQRRNAGVDSWVVHCLQRKGEPLVKGFTRFESAAHWVAFMSGATTHKY